jgi:hypothetical protein
MLQIAYHKLILCYNRFYSKNRISVFLMYFLVYSFTCRRVPFLTLKMDVIFVPKRRYLSTTLNGIASLKILILLSVTLRTTNLTHFSVTLQHCQLLRLLRPTYSHIWRGSFFARYSPATSLAALYLALSDYKS